MHCEVICAMDACPLAQAIPCIRCLSRHCRAKPSASFSKVVSLPCHLAHGTPLNLACLSKSMA